MCRSVCLLGGAFGVTELLVASSWQLVAGLFPFIRQNTVNYFLNDIPANWPFDDYVSLRHAGSMKRKPALDAHNLYPGVAAFYKMDKTIIAIFRQFGIDKQECRCIFFN